MGAMASQISSLTSVHLPVYSGADKRKHQISTSLAFVRGIHRWPVNSPHKLPVTRKMFPFGDIIMIAVMRFSFSWFILKGLKCLPGYCDKIGCVSKPDIQCIIPTSNRCKIGGAITNNCCLQCIIFVQCAVYNAHWRKCTANHVKMCS